MRAVLGIMGFLLAAAFALLFASRTLDWVVLQLYQQPRVARIALFTTFGDASLNAMREEVAAAGKGDNLEWADGIKDATDIAIVAESWEQLRTSDSGFGGMAYDAAKASDLLKYNSVTLSLKRRQIRKHDL